MLQVKGSKKCGLLPALIALQLVPGLSELFFSPMLSDCDLQLFFRTDTQTHIRRT
jgi:hypothetical protein